ncbi:MAG: hypothetical protein QM765_40125 [Myxococcales bacterium]
MANPRLVPLKVATLSHWTVSLAASATPDQETVGLASMVGLGV